MVRKTINAAFRLVCIALTMILCSFNVNAEVVGYEVDMSYDTATTSNVGTFPISNIKAVFNGASKPSTAGTGAAVQTAASYGDGKASGSAVYTYSDQSTGTVSVIADLEANRTNDGTYGLKYDFTEAKTAEGIALSTRAKATDGTRDLYFSVWIKPLKADGTLAEYSTNSISTSTFTERNNAPFGVYLTYTDADGSAAGAMFLSEANAVEETTADGWRKISAIIPATYANSIRFTVYAIKYTDNENSHGYGTADRSYLLVDDIYLAEIPTRLAFDDENVLRCSPFKTLDLSTINVFAVDAVGANSETTNYKWSVNSADATIKDNKVIYDGNPYISEEVELKAEYSDSVYATKKILFETDVWVDEITDNNDGTYSVQIINKGDASATACLVAAVYDDKNAMRSISYVSEENIEANGTRVLTTDEISTEGITQPVVKLFVRDSLFGFTVLK